MRVEGVLFRLFLGHIYLGLRGHCHAVRVQDGDLGLLRLRCLRLRLASLILVNVHHGDGLLSLSSVMGDLFADKDASFGRL